MVGVTTPGTPDATPLPATPPQPQQPLGTVGVPSLDAAAAAPAARFAALPSLAAPTSPAAAEPQHSSAFAAQLSQLNDAMARLSSLNEKIARDVKSCPSRAATPAPEPADGGDAPAPLTAAADNPLFRRIPASSAGGARTSLDEVASGSSQPPGLSTTASQQSTHDHDHDRLEPADVDVDGDVHIAPANAGSGPVGTLYQMLQNRGARSGRGTASPPMAPGIGGEEGGVAGAAAMLDSSQASAATAAAPTTAAIDRDAAPAPGMPTPFPTGTARGRFTASPPSPSAVADRTASDAAAPPQRAGAAGSDASVISSASTANAAAHLPQQSGVGGLRTTDINDSEEKAGGVVDDDDDGVDADAATARTPAPTTGAVTAAAPPPRSRAATPVGQGSWQGVPFVSPGPRGAAAASATASRGHPHTPFAAGPQGAPSSVGRSGGTAFGSVKRPAGNGPHSATTPQNDRVNASLLHSELRLSQQQKEALEAQLLKVKNEAYAEQKALKKEIAELKQEAAAAAGMRGEYEEALRGRDALLAERDALRQRVAARETDVQELEEYLKQLAERVVLEERQHEEWRVRGEAAEAQLAAVTHEFDAFRTGTEQQAAAERDVYHREAEQLRAAMDVAARQAVAAAHEKAEHEERRQIIDQLRGVLDERDQQLRAATAEADRLRRAAPEDENAGDNGGSKSAGDGAASLKAALMERDRALSEKSAEIDVLETALKALRRRLAEVARDQSEALSTEQARVVGELRRTLEEQNAAIKELVAKDRRTAAEVASQKSSIERLTEEVDVRDGTIRLLKADVATRMREGSQQVQNDAHALREKDDAIARLSQSLAEATHTLKQREGELERLAGELHLCRKRGETGEVESLLAVQGVAMQRDALVLSLQEDVASLRTRHTAVLKEKDLLMKKLVEERAKEDVLRSTMLLQSGRSGSGSVGAGDLASTAWGDALPSSGGATATTAAMGGVAYAPRRRSYFNSRDVETQTQASGALENNAAAALLQQTAASAAARPTAPGVGEAVGVCTTCGGGGRREEAAAPTPQELLHLTIDELKQQIEQEAAAARREQRALLETTHRVGNLRDALQKKLEREMQKLSKERSRQAVQQRKFEAGLRVGQQQQQQHGHPNPEAGIADITNMLADLDQLSPISSLVSPLQPQVARSLRHGSGAPRPAATAAAAPPDIGSMFSLSPMASPSSWGDDLFLSAGRGGSAGAGAVARGSAVPRGRSLSATPGPASAATPATADASIEHLASLAQDRLRCINTAVSCGERRAPPPPPPQGGTDRQLSRSPPATPPRASAAMSCSPPFVAYPSVGSSEGDGGGRLSGGAIPQPLAHPPRPCETSTGGDGRGADGYGQTHAGAGGSVSRTTTTRPRPSTSPGSQRFTPGLGEASPILPRMPGSDAIVDTCLQPVSPFDDGRLGPGGAGVHPNGYPAHGARDLSLDGPASTPTRAPSPSDRLHAPFAPSSLVSDPAQRFQQLLSQQRLGFAAYHSAPVVGAAPAPGASTHALPLPRGHVSVERHPRGRQTSPPAPPMPDAGNLNSMHRAVEAAAAASSGNGSSATLAGDGMGAGMEVPSMRCPTLSPTDAAPLMTHIGDGLLRGMTDLPGRRSL